VTVTLVRPENQTDPLTFRPLPTTVSAPGVSQDAPSAGPTRPFGLTRTTELPQPKAPLPLDGLRYDPQRQLTITRDGEAAVSSVPLPLAVTHQNTQYDHQWVTDNDEG